MPGKPRLPTTLFARIRRLAARGGGRRQIAEQLGCSVWAVRKATVPGFVEAERARHRRVGKARYEARKGDPDYVEYQAIYNKTPGRLATARAVMARIRSKRRSSQNKKGRK